MGQWGGLKQRICMRKKDGKEYLFVLNYKEYPCEIDCREPLRDLLSGQILSGKHTLEPYGVRVLTRDK